MKLETQGLLTKDPEVKAINKELREMLEVKTAPAVNRRSQPLRRRTNSMESTKVVAKNNSRSNSKERSSIGRPGKENNLKQVKKGHKKVSTPKTTVN